MDRSPSSVAWVLMEISGHCTSGVCFVSLVFLLLLATFYPQKQKPPSPLACRRVPPPRPASRTSAGVGVSVPGAPRAAARDALQDVHIDRELAAGGPQERGGGALSHRPRPHQHGPGVLPGLGR